MNSETFTTFFTYIRFFIIIFRFNMFFQFNSLCKIAIKEIFMNTFKVFIQTLLFSVTDTTYIASKFFRFLCPRFLTFSKLSMISHALLWLLLFLQISLFIYFNLGHGPIRAKNNVNKQTNLKNNNNQSWAWLIMLNFGNVKNLGH